jgi:hypothetical protein
MHRRRSHGSSYQAAAPHPENLRPTPARLAGAQTARAKSRLQMPFSGGVPLPGPSLKPTDSAEPGAMIPPLPTSPARSDPRERPAIATSWLFWVPHPRWIPTAVAQSSYRYPLEQAEHPAVAPGFNSPASLQHGMTTWEREFPPSCNAARITWCIVNWRPD